MKKLIIFAAVTGLVFAFAVAAIGTVGIVYARSQAQTTNPPVEIFPGQGMMNGRGMLDGQGMLGAGSGRMGSFGFSGSHTGSGYGPIHEYMIAALAEGLSLTAEDLQAKLDAGQTPLQVAQEAGLSEEEITTLFTNARTAALQAAVEAGAISQEQADWRQQRQQQMWQNGGLPGNCTGGGMMRGQRWNDQS